MKEDYRASALENIIVTAEYGDSPERLRETLKQAATLPYCARAYIADKIQQAFAERVKILNTNATSDKLRLMACMDMERIHFVTDTLGKHASLPARIFAYKALGGDTPEPDSFDCPSDSSVQALCETSKVVHHFTFDKSVKDIIAAFEYVLIHNVKDLEARTLRQPPLVRLFIAEKLEATFLHDKMDTAVRGVEKKRKMLLQSPPGAYTCTVNAKILDLIVRIKGDATPLFIRQLARDLAPFQDRDYQDVPRYIDLFFNAYEATEDGIDPVARKKQALETQINNLRALRPKTPSLKPKT